MSFCDAVVADAVLAKAAPRGPVPKAVGLPQGHAVGGRKRRGPERSGLTLKQVNQAFDFGKSGFLLLPLGFFQGLLALDGLLAFDLKKFST